MELGGSLYTNLKETFAGISTDALVIFDHFSTKDDYSIWLKRWQKLFPLSWSTENTLAPSF